MLIQRGVGAAEANWVVEEGFVGFGRLESEGAADARGLGVEVGWSRDVKGGMDGD